MYTSSSKMKKWINSSIEPYKDSLKSYIDALNHLFYQETEALYYDLFGRRGKVKF